MTTHNAVTPIHIHLEADLEEEPIFVNHAVVIFDGATYTLRFFQVLPPTISNDEIPDRITGRHMVTLLVSAGNMPAILDILQNLVEQGVSDVSSS